MKTVVILPEKLNQSAQPVLAEMLDFCMDGDMWIDGSSVQHLGARCLEMLFAASHTVLGKNHTLAFLATSEAMRCDLSMLGTDQAALEQSGTTK